MRNFLKLFIFGSIVAVNVAILTLFGIFVYYSQQLPQLSSLADYRPALHTEVYSQDGVLIGSFLNQRNEKRKLITLEELPPHVMQAFLASEDSSFYEHSGINIIAIFRAAITNLIAGKFVQGGSTITQQVAKSLLLTPERKLSRKIKELIIAWRMEKNLTKREVLYLYLNNIYLGYQAYGVAAAAENYFGKKAGELTVGEAALLAGLPKAPGKFAPHQDPFRAKERQLYVLRRMKEEGYITEEVLQQAAKEVITIKPLESLNLKYAPYFVELIRQRLTEMFPDDDFYSEGWRVLTTLDSEMQAAATRAVQVGLEELDRRRGYRGPKENVPREKWTEYWQRRAQLLLEENEKKNHRLLPIDDYKLSELVKKQRDEEAKTRLIEELFAKEFAARVAQKQPLIVDGVVSKIDDQAGYALVDIFNRKAVLKFKEMNWARRPDPNEPYFEGNMISRISAALRVGDVISVKMVSILSDADREAAVKRFKDKKQPIPPEVQFGIHGELYQASLAQSALLSADVRNGQIRAMVGGRDFSDSEFNRAIQSKRQPGSAFKPLTYAVALDRGFTPASVIVDSPITFVNDEDNKKWQPKNYDMEFTGDTLFSTSLMKSRNVTTIKILNEVGLDPVIDFAHRCEIGSTLEKDFTLALGSSGVSLWELMHPYYVFASGGYLPRFHFIAAIYDRDGKLITRMTEYLPEMSLEESVAAVQWYQLGRFRRMFKKNLDWVKENWAKDGGKKMGAGGFLMEKDAGSKSVFDQPAQETAKSDPSSSTGARKDKFTYTPIRPTQVISSQTAYVMTHLLSEVVRFGTGFRARELKRPASGKTGTTDDNWDAWFMGYTPTLLTGVWVGFDDLAPLGKLETGSRAASPIWVHFMQDALDGYPVVSFKVPDGIEFAKIDVKTGLLATEASKSAYEEAFKAGTAPKEYYSKESKTPNYQQFFDEEF